MCSIYSTNIVDNLPKLKHVVGTKDIAMKQDPYLRGISSLLRETDI